MTTATKKRVIEQPDLDSIIFSKRNRLNPNTIINLITPYDLEHVILLSTNLQIERMMMFSIMDTIYRALPQIAHREIKHECNIRNKNPKDSQLLSGLQSTQSQSQSQTNLNRFQWKKNDKRLLLARTKWLVGTKLLFKHPAYYQRFVFYLLFVKVKMVVLLLLLLLIVIVLPFLSPINIIYMSFFIFSFRKTFLCWIVFVLGSVLSPKNLDRTLSGESRGMNRI